jgi:hypothetical protein
MESFLRDPIWQFVGVVISIAALVVAIVAVKFQWLRKSLAYHTTFDRHVFFLFDKRFADRLQITLDGEPIKTLSTVDITVFNDGNIPIVPTDYVEPISIGFQEGARVFAHSIVEASPEGVKPVVTRTGNTFVVDPLLLNPNDEITIQFLVEAEPMARHSISARIAGVKAFLERPYRNRLRNRVSHYAYKLTPVLVFLAVLALGAIGNGVFDAIKYVLALVGGAG